MGRDQSEPHAPPGALGWGAELVLHDAAEAEGRAAETLAMPGVELHVLLDGVAAAEPLRRATAAPAGFAMRAGSALLLRRAEPERWRVAAPASARLRGTVLRLDPDALRGLAEEDPAMGERLHGISAAPEALPAQALLPLAAALFSAPGGALGRLWRDARTLDLIAAALGFAPPARPARRDRDRAREAARLLALRLRDPPGLGALARGLGTNRRQLAEAFKAEHGASVGEWVREERMRRAVALLSGGGVGVAEVAAAVGFASPANFATAFRRRFGATPSSLLR